MTPIEDALLYAKVTRGFKSGGFYGGFALTPPEVDPYTEETVGCYEAGFKSQWLDRTLRLNGAVFYYDYSDVQGFTQTFSMVTGTSLTKLGNIGDAEHIGFELDFVWLPAAIEGLTLSGGFSVLDAELDSSETYVTQDLQVVSFDGLDRGYAPDFSYFIQGRYERPIASNLLGTVQINYSWRDDQLEADNFGSPVDSALQLMGSYGIMNARVQIGPSDGRWHVAFVGKNLIDEEYLANTTFDNLGSYLNTYGIPFSWALEVNYKWR